MPKKVLFTSHTANFAKFNLPFMRWFQEQGWEVHYACGDDEAPPACDRTFCIPFSRSPYSLQNLRAYRELKRVIDTENYDIIHCHTPVGGVVTRLAASKARKKGTRVLYTAHGFHFYRGAPKFNWLFFYPVEKWLARRTDCLITMNEEDYSRAVDRHFRAGRIEKIDGVGVSLQRFRAVDSNEQRQIRQELDLPADAFILIYVAEFIPRKNHQLLLGILPELKKTLPGLQVLFAGVGALQQESREECERLGIAPFVHFLGYRRDVDRLYQAADLLVAPSHQEGLPINVIEGMASGLPVVCSAIRGQTDVIREQRNGLLAPDNDANAFRHAIERLAQDPSARQAMREANLEDVQQYSLDHALGQMAAIYRRYMNETEEP